MKARCYIVMCILRPTGSLSILDILMGIPEDGYLVDVHKEAVATYVLERKGHM